MIPTLISRWDMITFDTASQFIPPWCSYSIWILGLVEIVYPFCTAFGDAFSDPVNCSGGTLFLVLMTSRLDFGQVRKAKGKGRMGDGCQSSGACGDLIGR